MLSKFAGKLVEKSRFPRIKSLEYEYKKAGILRILLGIIIFIRFFQIYIDYNLFSGEHSWILFTNLVLIVLFTIGFSLPITITLLIFFVRFGDGVASTATLGTTILIQTFFVFLLMNSGEYFTLDKIIAKKKNVLSKFIKFQYSIIGRHDKTSLRTLYFFAFFTYALISFGAILDHIQDYYWINGLTVKSLLSNSFLSSFFESFRSLESNYPKAISIFSIIGVVFQGIFQFLMLVIIFSRVGAFFIKWWGMQFFIISLFVINLSYLPHIEIILWLMIFFPTPFLFKSNNSDEKIGTNVFDVPNRLNKKLFKFFYSSYAVICLVFIFIWFPYVSQHTANILGPSRRVVRGIVYKAGLEIPSVFNKVDLSMGDCWMVIYRKKENEDKWSLVPITSEIGERINYSGHNVLSFSNHNSDFLYFGTTLVYRRTIIYTNDYKTFHEKGFGFESLVKRIKYDYLKENISENCNYRVTVYKNESSEVSHWKNDSDRHQKEVVYTSEYQYDGSSFKKLK